MALSIAMPILANGVRAWGTIFIAEYHGIAFAAGFDHIFYGWIFFAVVMALVMLIAWRFFDRAIDDQMIDADAVIANPMLVRVAGFATSQPKGFAIMVAFALTFTGWGAWANRLEAPVPALIVLPQVNGWTQVDYTLLAPWQPLHSGAEHVVLGRYADASGHIVDVSFALYAAQGDGREAGGFGQGALPMNSAWAWAKTASSIGGGQADRIQTAGPIHRLTETYYRSGAILTGSNTRLKLQNITDRFLLQSRTTAALVFSSEDQVSGRPSAEKSLRAFLNATGPVDAWMDRVAAGR